MNWVHLCIVFVTALVSTSQALPFFDLFFGNPQTGHRTNYNQRSRGRSYAPGGGYNDYKRICKVINPDPYAFIGSNPYPGAPFCPP